MQKTEQKKEGKYLVNQSNSDQSLSLTRSSVSQRIVTKVKNSLFLTLALVLANPANATILPENDLYLEDGLRADSNISETEFMDLTAAFEEFARPWARVHGHGLILNKLWEDPTVNASAGVQGAFWVVNMYGGLARRPEVTPDAFIMVMCHEFGHLIAGYPFKEGRLAANEGEADYFASQTCTKAVWAATSPLSRPQSVQDDVVIPQPLVRACALTYRNSVDYGICIRSNRGGFHLALLLSRLRKEPKEPSFLTPDTRVVSEMDNSHPPGQCRLDTYVTGSLCNKSNDLNVIPGAKVRSDLDREREALRYSCDTAGSARPRCWFKSVQASSNLF